MQWNCIDRSILIDNLGFRNTYKKYESIVCKYNYLKKNKARDKYTTTNLHANPENLICTYF